MEDYIEASLAFIESNEMRDYLRKELPKFCSVAMACAEIVAYAPAPVERKLPVLELNVRESEPVLACDGRPFTDYASRFIRSCRTALEERYSGPDGTMFRLRASSYNGDKSCLFDNAFFTKFDAAIRYLEQLAEKYPDDCAFQGLSYTITKYVPDGKEGLKEYCTWYLNGTGELWYFGYELSSRELPKGWRDLLDYLGAHLNLPVPFQPGDIVLTDCLPYAAPRRTLILSVGDNRDCCCLWSLSIGKDGQLFAGAFKHNSFLRPSEYSHISGLYRATKWMGELTAEEKPFAVLSPLIHARPELGIELDNYFCKEENSKTWQEVKKAFGL